MIDIKEFFRDGEEPLDSLVTDGGFSGVFRRVGCIGDSLSSGEFQGIDENGQNTYIDMFDYSWGQYMARFGGFTVRNFSRGGMTAKEYVESFADQNDFWNKGRDCQAFVVALGVNDISRIRGNGLAFGSMDDIDFDNPDNNRPTFVGYYARILQKIMKEQPHVHFFLMTIPRDDNDDNEEWASLCDRHAALMYELAAAFPRTWVMDFRKYAPIYDAYFREKFYLDGHMNPAGYLLTGKMVASYLDYIVRHNMDKFHQIGFIGTPNVNPKYFK